MTNVYINRRSFLKNAGKTSGFVVLAGGVVQLSSFNAWAAKKSAINNHCQNYVVSWKRYVSR